MAGNAAAKLRAALAGADPVLAPVAIDPLGANLAERHGFDAVYLGGGALGYVLTVTEARLTSSDVVYALQQIVAVSDLPVIVDGTTGFGDPIHVMRTVRGLERAGAAAIEIEDQLTPKHAHHQRGIDHPISLQAMVEKVQAAVEAREDPDFLLIARTNTIGEIDFAEGIRRANAYADAGADMILAFPRTEEEFRLLPREIGKPLAAMLSSRTPLSAADLGKLGYRLLIEAQGPMMAAYAAMVRAYDDLRADGRVRLDAAELQRLRGEIDDACDLPRLWEIEARTTELPERIAQAMGSAEPGAERR
jgi:methylisocitrate lyase